MITLVDYLLYTVLLLTSILLILLLSTYKWHTPMFYRKIAKLPSPKMHFMIGFVMQAVKLRFEDWLPYVEVLWKDLGDIIHIQIMGWSQVFVLDPEDIETIFSNNAYITKGVEYNLLTPWMGEGLLTSTGNKWHMRRKQLTPSFHFKILENYIPTLNKHAIYLTKKLESISTAGKSAKIRSLISSQTLDVICETTMGTSLNSMSNDVINYIAAIKTVSEITLTRVVKFWMYSEWIFRISPSGREYKRGLQQIHSFVGKIIQQRKQARVENNVVQSVNITDNENVFGIYKQRKSFLDHLLDIQEENPDKMTDQEILDEVNTFMFEGHDTISSAITWTLFMLATYPEVQNRVREELNEIFGDDEDREVRASDLHKMQYLEMVLKETLRLYPSVPFITRETPVDLKLKQHLIPAGANLAILPYLIHRNPNVFPDPEKFNPERFSPDNARSYHPYAYLPFSAGYRNCIGQRFAMMEAKIMLSMVLRKFEITTTMKQEEIKIIPSIVLQAVPKIRLSFRPLCASK